MHDGRHRRRWTVRIVLTAIRIGVWIACAQLVSEAIDAASIAAVRPGTLRAQVDLQQPDASTYEEDLTACAASVKPVSTSSGHETNAQEDLLTWAMSERGSSLQSTTSRGRSDGKPALSPRLPAHTRLLIGVKSAVIVGFAPRQLLRQTWADPARLPDGVSVVFLGCEPASTPSDSNSTARRELNILEAVQLEKDTYQDLLTGELHCKDSYWTLVDKIKGFFRWTATTSASSLPHLAFVMLVDDDVYVRVDRLVQSLPQYANLTTKATRFYAGQVVSTQFHGDLGLERDPREKNWVPFAQYPMQHKPPFATGAHYVLSLDLVHFLARNDRVLAGIGTLEDVSVAYWLQGLLQVQPQHVPEFNNVRYTLCHSDLIAYGDLSPLAMREMDANLRGNRSLCDGFSFTRWDKRVFAPQFPAIHTSDPHRINPQVMVQWSLSLNSLLREFIVSATAIAETSESVSLAFAPTKEGFAYFCMKLAARIEHAMPTTALRPMFCQEQSRALQELLRETSESVPAKAHLCALPLSDVKFGTNSAIIHVRLTPRAIRWRTMVECLFAVAFPDVFVGVDAGDAFLSDFPPDVVFATEEDLHDGLALASDPATAHELGTIDPRQRSQLPPMARLVLLATAAIPTRMTPLAHSTHRDRAILLSAIAHEPFHHQDRHLFLPAASSSFANRIHHTPRQLLQPVQREKMVVGSDVVAGVCCSDRSSEDGALDSVRTFANLLNTLGVTSSSRCHPSYNETPPPFQQDLDVQRCQQLKFAIVFEDHPDTPGYIGHHIVSAFLASSIPIYYGHSATASWLFNPKAFIDCRSFGSMDACAEEVARVAGSEELYESMRGEAAVVNVTAFMEVFSWHPDALSVVAEVDRKETMGERFRRLLLRV